MARFPAFATSLVVHGATFAILVVVPVFAPDTLPEPGGSPPPLPTWPLHPRVVLADSRPPATPRSASPRRMLAAAMPSDAAAATPLPIEEPSQLPTDDASATAFLVGGEPGAGPEGPGSGECCGTGEGGDGTPGAGEGGGGEASPLRVGGEVRPPAKLRHVAPRYPPLALQARISGTVELDCLIDEAGRVTGVRVLSGHPFLAPAAVAAVQQWLYSPTRLNGVPVAVLLTVSVRFEIRR